VEIKLFNSLTGKKEIFKSIKEKQVSLYVCGPTVYDNLHLGNARPLITFDILHRALNAAEYEVKHVSNITDVDDKIINRAKEQSISESALVEKTTVSYLQVISDLNIIDNIEMPKVTDYIEPMINYIQKMVDSKHAYLKEGSAYFRVNSVEQYGILSNMKLDSIITADSEVAADKESASDFAL